MATQNFVQFKLTPDTRASIKELQSLLGGAEFNERIVKFLDVRAQRIAGNIVKTRLSGPPQKERSTALRRNALRRRTGTLARSVIGRGEILGGVPAFRVGVLRGPAVRYIAVQELGTVGKGGELPTIRPTKAKALAIPIDGALTAAGVERFGGPRNAPVKLRFIPFRRGVAVGKLVDERQLEAEQERAAASGGDVDFTRVTSYYLLVRQVDISPKHFLRDGVRAALPTLTTELSNYVSRLLATAKGTRP